MLTSTIIRIVATGRKNQSFCFHGMMPILLLSKRICSNLQGHHNLIHRPIFASHKTYFPFGHFLLIFAVHTFKKTINFSIISSNAKFPKKFLPNLLGMRNNGKTLKVWSLSHHKFKFRSWQCQYIHHLRYFCNHNLYNQLCNRD